MVSVKQQPMKVDELIDSINQLTKQIDEDIARQDFEVVEDALVQRLALISELIEKCDDKDFLLSYINELREHNLKCITCLQTERDVVQENLIKINKLEKYIS